MLVVGSSPDAPWEEACVVVLNPGPGTIALERRCLGRDLDLLTRVESRGIGLMVGLIVGHGVLVLVLLLGVTVYCARDAPDTVELSYWFSYVVATVDVRLPEFSIVVMDSAVSAPPGPDPVGSVAIGVHRPHASWHIDSIHLGFLSHSPSKAY